MHWARAPRENTMEPRLYSCFGLSPLDWIVCVSLDRGSSCESVVCIQNWSSGINANHLCVSCALRLSRSSSIAHNTNVQWVYTKFKQAAKQSPRTKSHSSSVDLWLPSAYFYQLSISLHNRTPKKRGMIYCCRLYTVLCLFSLHCDGQFNIANTVFLWAWPNAGAWILGWIFLENHGMLGTFAI